MFSNEKAKKRCKWPFQLLFFNTVALVQVTMIPPIFSCFFMNVDDFSTDFRWSNINYIWTSSDVIHINCKFVLYTVCINTLVYTNGIIPLVCHRTQVSNRTHCTWSNMFPFYTIRLNESIEFRNLNQKFWVKTVFNSKTTNV